MRKNVSVLLLVLFLVIGSIFLQSRRADDSVEGDIYTDGTKNVAKTTLNEELNENELEEVLEEKEIDLPEGIEEQILEEEVEENPEEALISVDTSKSSWVQAASYSPNENTLYLTLNTKKYAYASVPKSLWDEFSVAESFGSFYNARIKNQYPLKP